MVVFGKRHWHDKYDNCKREQGNGVKTIINKETWNKIEGYKKIIQYGGAPFDCTFFKLVLTKYLI